MSCLLFTYVQHKVINIQYSFLCLVAYKVEILHISVILSLEEIDNAWHIIGPEWVRNSNKLSDFIRVEHLFMTIRIVATGCNHAPRQNSNTAANYACVGVKSPAHQPFKNP